MCRMLICVIGVHDLCGFMMHETFLKCVQEKQAQFLELQRKESRLINEREVAIAFEIYMAESRILSVLNR